MPDLSVLIWNCFLEVNNDSKGILKTLDDRSVPIGLYTGTQEGELINTVDFLNPAT